MAKNKNTFSAEPFGNELRDIKDGLETHNLSKKMCECIENQVDINNAIKNLVKNSLKSDVDTQDKIKDIINKHAVYKLGLWMPTIITFITSIVWSLLMWIYK